MQCHEVVNKSPLSCLVGKMILNTKMQRLDLYGNGNHTSDVVFLTVKDMVTGEISNPVNVGVILDHFLSSKGIKTFTSSILLQDERELRERFPDYVVL